MIERDSVKAAQALEKAAEALRQNRTTETRRWAMLAASLNPDIETPWLILASISKPHASLVYFQKALEINPASPKAKKGIHWALQKIRSENRPPEISSTPPLGITRPQPRPKPVEHIEPTHNLQTWRSVDHTSQRSISPIRPAHPAKRTKITVPLILSWVGIVLAVCVGISLWLGLPLQWTVFASSSSAVRPVDAFLKPSLTASSTATPTVTNTSTPSPTPSFTPTNTPTNTPTSTPTQPPTHTPRPVVVEQADRPVSIGNGERWIDVNLSEQRTYAFEGDQIVNSFVVSTGTWQHPTVTGQFSVYVKYRSAPMRGPGYYLPGVPYIMYFYKGYGLHGTYWHNNFGTPMSHGCINLRTEDAAWLFNWASVGTLVNIHY
jgi:lipoprotein-anchoring transpeptidase ErfK/SrfK